VTRPTSAFTLVEVLVAVTLMSLIVIALMAVFNGTQTAFRAGVTQTDVLENGRAAIDLIAADLRQMSPSLGTSNSIAAVNSGLVPVNFYTAVPSGYSLVQPLVASSQQRTYVLENFFILSSGNQNGVPTWYGAGYAVVTNAPNGSLYSLYHFYANCPMAAAGAPAILFTNFLNFAAAPTNSSRLMDGVVELRVRAFDVNGGWMTNQIIPFGSQTTTNKNVSYLPSSFGETGFYMFSNTLPAAVEIELGALEDRTLQRAESFAGSPSAQSNYLAGAAGKVHIFRQRISIPNVDPSAYQ
jgi:type II secretory pathway pseudopilin PulG